MVNLQETFLKSLGITPSQLIRNIIYKNVEARVDKFSRIMVRKLTLIFFCLLVIFLLVLVSCNREEDSILSGRLFNLPPSCSDECSTKGQTTCVGDYVKLCKNYDSDPCLEWTAGTKCQLGCINGACVTCTDSDGGAYPDVKGTVTISGPEGVSKTPDECQGFNVLEASCSSTAERSLNLMSCQPSTCSAGSCKGKLCYAGACATYTCTDSDGGEYPDVKGTATISGPEGIIGTMTDICKGNDAINEVTCLEARSMGINEVYCESDKICYNGACVPVSCTDSDGGFNLNVKGTAIVISLAGTWSSTDVCQGANVVSEATCVDTELFTYSTSCGPNKICYNGACGDQTCTDSDGTSPTTKGTVTISGPAGTGSQDDWCSGSAAVYERYCLGNEPATTLISCASGTCKEGACQ